MTPQAKDLHGFFIPLKLMAKFSVKTLLIMVSLIAVAMTVVVNLLPPPPLHFRYPSSDKIIALAADRADKLNIEITKLGSNIYGLEIGQINRDGQSYKYASAIHAHTFTSDNPDDLSRARQAEIEGQYASHWRQQAGWRDHCRDLKISRGAFLLDAAKSPQSVKAWRQSDAEVHIRFCYADTPSQIEEGIERLRSCARDCIEFTSQNNIDDTTKVFLYLELFEPTNLGTNKRF